MILIFDKKPDWCSECDSMLKTRLNVNEILFVSLKIIVKNF